MCCGPHFQLFPVDNIYSIEMIKISVQRKQYVFFVIIFIEW